MPRVPHTPYGVVPSPKPSSSQMPFETALASRRGAPGGALPDTRAKWPIRWCKHCGNNFRKPPTYATCGHPKCVKLQRYRKRGKSNVLESWTPPDIYARDTKSREKVWRYLNKIEVKHLPYEVVESISIKTNLKPAEVLEIWKSVKKEKSSA